MEISTKGLVKSNGCQDHGHFLVLNGGMLNFYDIDDPIDVEVTVQAMKGIGNEVKKWTKQLVFSWEMQFTCLRYFIIKKINF